MGHETVAKTWTQIIVVGVNDATRLRKACHFPLQRTIRDRNVERLGLEMEKGRFVQGTPVFFAVLPDGTQYIVNGNHTLEAIAYSGKPQLLTFVFLRVRDFAEAARVYACFDVHKARTWSDAVKAVGLDKKFPLSKETTSAVGLIMQSFKYSPDNVEANSSRGSRFDVVDDYETPISLLHEAWKGAPALNRRICLRAAVLAVALETVRYQPVVGVDFWTEVAHDDALPKGNPAKTLLTWLISHPAGKAAESYLMSRACANAWNAYWAEKPLSQVRPTTAGKFVLHGTPWHAKREEDPAPAGCSPRTAPGPAADGQSALPEVFDTGVRVTRDGSEPVLVQKAAVR